LLKRPPTGGGSRSTIQERARQVQKAILKKVGCTILHDETEEEEDDDDSQRIVEAEGVLIQISRSASQKNLKRLVDVANLEAIPEPKRKKNLQIELMTTLLELEK